MAQAGFSTDKLPSKAIERTIRIFFGVHAKRFFLLD